MFQLLFLQQPTHSDMKIVFSQKYRNEVLHEMKYSPCGNYLAVGSNDNYVDIFKVPNYKRVGVCHGSYSTRVLYSSTD